MDAFHIFDEFVQKNDTGVECCCAQTEQDTDEPPFSAHFTDAGDHHKTQGGHHKADQLLFRKLFPEENGTDQGYNHRGKVVTEGCHGNSGVLIGLKQEDPVETHGNTGGKQQRNLFPDL